MLIKRKSGETSRGKLQALTSGLASGTIDRRTFLKRSGPRGRRPGRRRLDPARLRAQGGGARAPGAPIEIRKNICTHCSVGCTVTAEVQNGVWVGQEPSWESPINRGTHCAKGASVREIVHGERRLKYPMKLVGGQWQRLSWDQAINEIGDKLNDIRAKSGADPVFWLGSASSPTRAPICSASSAPSGGRTPSITRRASAIRPPWRAWRTPGATARRPIPTTICAIPRRCSSSAGTRPRRTRSPCSTCCPARRSTGRTSSSPTRVSPARPLTARSTCGCARAPTSRS